MTRSISLAIALVLGLTGCGASLKDIASGPCGFDLTCDPDDPGTWPLPPLKLIGSVQK